MKILKEGRAIPQPQPTTETVTTYELTQEEMYVLLETGGLTCRTQRRTCMTDKRAEFFGNFYMKHVDTVRENQP